MKNIMLYHIVICFSIVLSTYTYAISYNSAKEAIDDANNFY